MSAKRYWKIPLLRTHLRDGLIAYGNIRYLLMAAGSQLFISMLLPFPVWFFGRCVLVDTVSDVLGGAFCRPLPFLYTYQWQQFVLFVTLAVLLYVIIYRFVLRFGLYVRLGNYFLTPAAIFAFFFGLEYGRWVTAVMTDAGSVTMFGHLVVFLAGPVVAWLWNLHMTLWMKWCAYTLLPDGEASVIVSRLALRRGAFIGSGDEVTVRRTDDRLVVIGPLDAVATARLNDLVVTSYPERLRVIVETTLDDAAYYKHDRDRLARTRYDDKPLEPPGEIPAAVVISGVVVFATLVVVALISGPGFSPGISGSDLLNFAAVEQQVSEMYRPDTRIQDIPTEEDVQRELERTVRDETTLAVPAFALDLSDAATYCPRLAESPPQRIFRMDTEHLVGMFMNPSDPTDTTRYGDTVIRVHAYYNGTYTFAFDRRTGSCVDQQRHASIGQARDVAQNDPRIVPGRWLDVPPDHDWHVVPPMPAAN